MLVPFVCLSPVVLPELLDEVSKKSSSLKHPTSPCLAPSQPNKKGAKQHVSPEHSLGMMGPFKPLLIHTRANKTLPKQQAVTHADFLFAAPEKTRLALKHNFLLQVRWYVSTACYTWPAFWDRIHTGVRRSKFRPTQTSLVNIITGHTEPPYRKSKHNQNKCSYWLSYPEISWKKLIYTDHQINTFDCAYTHPHECG